MSNEIVVPDRLTGWPSGSVEDENKKRQFESNLAKVAGPKPGSKAALIIENANLKKRLNVIDRTGTTYGFH